VHPPGHLGEVGAQHLTAGPFPVGERVEVAFEVAQRRPERAGVGRVLLAGLAAARQPVADGQHGLMSRNSANRQLPGDPHQHATEHDRGDDRHDRQRAAGT
jgi:hypothetical protein